MNNKRISSSEYYELQEQVKARTKLNKLIEQEVAAYSLEIEKYQEQILELENWIYLTDALQNDPSKINDVDKALNLMVDLKAESLSLKKELALTLKRQPDINQATALLHHKIAIKQEELNSVPLGNIEHAIKRMHTTSSLLNKELAKTIQENSNLSVEVVKQRDVCQKLEEADDEIEQLELANNNLRQIKAQYKAYFSM